ncbi:alpha/beta hydrolase [Nocardia terpenica]|uniref:Alpha/beta hydrolase n=1 Tax=Nocardia terpenica TaxID=455432 RepID=A0A161WNU3_9NOCA|nr:alpha/beta hydrolase [Nocardia terpenica]KZM74775.1 alpha/beta hydrolase [Nocardia terpenica]MBF6065391.1 alpha/beta hydrolase [Nocardia terpenica]MBF6108963.1 alpha/beta hydrolase [Nocardia terpenica]MBF6114725.1 alpha/beta hydrolase [Nocardia terpenica]MBF6121806.1 alpha/beta hydrolase [Nocardia terpenica]
MTNETPVAESRALAWQPDVLGTGYEQLTIPLGTDPDGEGTVEATLIRHTPADPAAETTTGAVLYLHGFTDYFFQRHLAEHMAARGFRFYALDLRKCGRSRREGQTAHYVTELALYDAELNHALRIVREETGLPVLVLAHSTGGLVASLWLDRLQRAGGVAAQGIIGLALNSPWFDLQGPSYYRTVGTPLIHGLGRLRAMAKLPGSELTTYGDSLHHSAAGEWDYNLDWKPLTGFPVHFGWLRAIRRGHAQLHRGLDVGVPALILRSKVTKFMRRYGPAADVSDVVLDVRQIQRWSGCLGDRTNIVPIEGARHDVFLSSERVRARAFAEFDAWLDWLADFRSNGAAAD